MRSLRIFPAGTGISRKKFWPGSGCNRKFPGPKLARAGLHQSNNQGTLRLLCGYKKPLSTTVRKGIFPLLHNVVKGGCALDIPRIFTITESAHRIHNPFTPENLATLGAALRMEPGARVLDLGSGSGEMLCTWARDYGITGIGIDMSQLFTGQAKLRAEELGVADRVGFIHGDAAGYVANEKVGVAACLGATWIGGGVAGTIGLLAKSLRPGGIILIGEPYWVRLPPTEDVARECYANYVSDFLMLPELLASFSDLDYDVVEMVLADQKGWDRYEAAKWLTMRRWLEANPDDDFVKEVRAKLTLEPTRYAAYTREYLGWGVFALMAR